MVSDGNLGGLNFIRHKAVFALETPEKDINLVKHCPCMEICHVPLFPLRNLIAEPPEPCWPSALAFSAFRRDFPVPDF